MQISALQGNDNVSAFERDISGDEIYTGMG